MKNGFYKKATLIALAIFTANSCTNRYDDIDLQSKSNTQQAASHKAIPIIPIIAGIVVLVDTITDKLEGQYQKITYYYPNGQIKSQVIGCVGTWGTCKAVARVANSGSPLTMDEEKIDSYDGEWSQNIRTQLIKCDLGILYAVDKMKNPKDSEVFFKDDTFNMTGTLVIDNPEILEQLQLSEPITVSGEYSVYESKQYKFIIIRE